MKNLDRSQIDNIYNILHYWLDKLDKTVLEACISVEYNSRGVFYKVCDGVTDADDNYVKMALACGVPYIVFVNEYLPSCNIQLDTRYSLRNQVILGYFENNSTEDKAIYEIDDLNELLEEKGACRL